MATHFLLTRKLSSGLSAGAPIRQRSPVIRICELYQSRGVASMTDRRAAPTFVIRRSVAAAIVDQGVLNQLSTLRHRKKAPPCGWRKTIVSSSSTAISAAEEEDFSPEPSLVDNPMSKNDQALPQDRDALLKMEVDMEELQNLASMRCTPLSLRGMYKYAVDFNNKSQRLLNAQFLHRELPIRLAQRAVDLLTLPHGLSEALPIRQVAHVYLLYLEKFQEFPMPTNSEEEDRFTDMLQSVILDRASIPNAVAQGVDTWLQTMQAGEEASSSQSLVEERLQEMELALYRFFTARVGLRFLTEHHILSAPSRRDSRNVVRQSQSTCQRGIDADKAELGCIQTDCNPLLEVQRVAESVRAQTLEHYGICPEIQLFDSTQKHRDTKFTYVPHHLHYMVGELLKNSCRATVRKHIENGTTEAIPPIRLVVVKGEEDVTIKIEDRGGGIPRSNLAKIWKFAHSTAGEEESTSDFGVDEVTGAKIRGFGLPLARIYARYLGGELTLKSTEGYGLDAYLHLPRLGDSCENLPLPVKFSPGELYSDPPKKASNTILD